MIDSANFHSLSHIHITDKLIWHIYALVLCALNFSIIQFQLKIKC